jgi:hypothetical protein
VDDDFAVWGSITSLALSQLPPEGVFLYLQTESAVGLDDENTGLPLTCDVCTVSWALWPPHMQFTISAQTDSLLSR